MASIKRQRLGPASVLDTGQRLTQLQPVRSIVFPYLSVFDQVNLARVCSTLHTWIRDAPHVETIVMDLNDSRWRVLAAHCQAHSRPAYAVAWSKTLRHLHIVSASGFTAEHGKLFPLSFFQPLLEAPYLETLELPRTSFDERFHDLRHNVTKHFRPLRRILTSADDVLFAAASFPGAWLERSLPTTLVEWRGGGEALPWPPKTIAAELQRLDLTLGTGASWQIAARNVLRWMKWADLQPKLSEVHLRGHLCYVDHLEDPTLHASLWETRLVNIQRLSITTPAQCLEWDRRFTLNGRPCPSLTYRENQESIYAPKHKTVTQDWDGKGPDLKENLSLLCLAQSGEWRSVDFLSGIPSGQEWSARVTRSWHRISMCGWEDRDEFPVSWPTTFRTISARSYPRMYTTTDAPPHARPLADCVRHSQAPLRGPPACPDIDVSANGSPDEHTGDVELGKFTCCGKPMYAPGGCPRALR